MATLEADVLGSQVGLSPEGLGQGQNVLVPGTGGRCSESPRLRGSERRLAQR